MVKSITSILTKNSKKTLIHILVWLAFISLNILQAYFERREFLIRNIIVLSTAVILFYINYFYLVPKLLLKKKTLFYIIFTIVLITISIYLNSLFFENVPPPVNDLPNNFPKPEKIGFRHFRFMFPMVYNISIIVIGTAIRIYEEWIKNERKKNEIETQKKSTELIFLKNQLNPHFLFNSLNSIYSLTTKKSNDAPEAVLTLSELMRYMLYKTDKDFVLLKDELEYIKNYLKLQRLRIANNQNVTINIHGNIGSQKIRPLLLISFIENAFKYGTDFMGNTEVKIVIYIEEDELKFSCINLIGNRKSKKDTHHGIGLKNTKERLELLYPNKHTLKIKEENNKFIVNLTLKLE